jgi:putative ABC transport system permease protein
MRLLAVVDIALRALAQNKLRSGLTALGVIVGVASVITMIAISSGARAAIDEEIASAGVNVIYVSAGSGGRGGFQTGAGGVQTLTLDDAAAIREQVSGIALMSPVVRGRAQVVAGALNWNTSFEGGNEDYFAIRSWPVADGVPYTAREVQIADKVCVLGDTVARTLFPDGNAVGQVMRIKNVPFRVLGVLAPKGQNQWGSDQDDIVIAPYTTVQKKLLGITHIQQIMLSATSSQAVEPTAVALTRVLRTRHRIPTPEEDDFRVRTIEEMAAMRTQLADTMTGLLMSVASVGLVVGGIGIMNIMLVSVTERTREIGIRLAVGARTRDILRQFLVEAMTLSLLGGLIGVLLGILSSRSVASLLGWPTLITPPAIGLAFAFAALVGAFFGYYPARKAASLDPIEALRYE